MNEWIQQKEIIGAIVGGAMAIGASFLPMLKYLYRKSKECKEEKAGNTNTITIENSMVGNQLQQIEGRIERIESILNQENRLVPHLEEIKREMSLVRSELIELRRKGV